MAHLLRTFIALPIPDVAAGFLKKVRDRLRRCPADVRWVPTANVHLTLKFLGTIEPAMVPMIVSRLDAAARPIPPISLTARGVGVFPNVRQARVLWVGLNGDLQQLGLLHEDLELKLEALGFKRERHHFRAHLTIGRMRRRPDAKTLGTLLESLDAEVSEPFCIGQVRLYQSILKPTGAEYTLLHAASLAASDADMRFAEK